MTRAPYAFLLDLLADGNLTAVVGEFDPCLRDDREFLCELQEAREKLATIEARVKAGYYAAPKGVLRARTDLLNRLLRSADARMTEVRRIARRNGKVLVSRTLLVELIQLLRAAAVFRPGTTGAELTDRLAGLVGEALPFEEGPANP